jgi:hypothetical protein
VASQGRPLFGPGGGPDLAVPLALDASGVGQAPPKLWLALARAAAAVGCAICLSPAQVAARVEVFRAARVVTLLAVGPDGPTAPATARAAGAVLLRLASREGVPALIDGAALPGWVEACRAITGYEAPVAASIPPGRRPPWWAVAEARAAGLGALLFEEGVWTAREPLAGAVGWAAQAEAAGSGIPCLLAHGDPPDGFTLSTLLAAGARMVLSAGPVEAAVRNEGSFAGDWKAHGDELAHALSVVWSDARRVARHAGCADPRDLTRDNLRATTYDAAALSGARLAGFDDRLPWWVH